MNRRAIPLWRFFSNAVLFNAAAVGKRGQANGNSGVYIRRRYEARILNSAGRSCCKTTATGSGSATSGCAC
jgi:hypothetical protein